MDPDQPKSKPQQPVGPPIRSAQPNNMTYTDDKGVEHSIYLPQGTMHAAYEHLVNERWDELAKFEPYSGCSLP